MPTSLTERLVAILVLLVVATSAVIVLVTTVSMHRILTTQSDEDIPDALRRAEFTYATAGDPTLRPGAGDRDRDGRAEQDLGPLVVTVGAYFARDGSTRGGDVVHPHPDEDGSTTGPPTDPLPAATLRRLDAVPDDGRVHQVELPGSGTFRVAVGRTDDGTGTKLVAGPSTARVDNAIHALLLAELLVAASATLLAVLVGRWVVRRQLRPLRDVASTAHQVAALPLSSGEIGTTVRVPAELSDQRSEVGAVGSALNTLLAHVEHALDERHRSEQQVRQFVADASHELRTPLTTIHGYAELSRRTRPADPAQLQLAMGKVEAEATRMSSLVEDLLLLARLDAGRPLAREEVDLTRLALETVADARVVAARHRWVLELPDEPVEVPGDEQRLHQVVTNLLGNARRHTPPGTTVTVTVSLDGTAAVLAVADDGPGMSPELVATAFERFTRGDSSRTRESGGAGLGLSLVEAITGAHGGTVGVTSEPGCTRFEVRLPVSVAAPEPLHR